MPTRSPFLAAGPVPAFLSSMVTPLTTRGPAAALGFSATGAALVGGGPCSRFFANWTFLSDLAEEGASSSAAAAVLAFLACFLLSFSVGSALDSVIRLSRDSSAARLFLPFLASTSLGA